MDLTGFPYFPGIARGPLQRPGLGPGGIELVAQGCLDDISAEAAGIIVVDGAPFSHPMIGLRTYGVPIVILDRAAAERLTLGTHIEIDGHTGRLRSVSPNEPPAAGPPSQPAAAPLTTRDGAAITLRASIRDVSGAAAARELGAAAIGLVRSEFLGSSSAAQPPGEGVFRQALRAVCEAAAPLAVDVRLVDIAPDKRPAWLPDIHGADSALGLQGARLFDLSPVREVIEAELSALDGLAAEFDLGVIIPYVSDVEELHRWAMRIRTAAPNARRVSAMAETPAAVLDIAHWLHHLDGVSIGCNDLMQCLFAADRDLAPLHRYLNPHAPVLYRLLDLAAREAGVGLHRVQLCGLLSQLPGIMPVLIGLGFRIFSVDPRILPDLARTVQTTTLAAARGLAAAVLAASDAQRAGSLIHEDHRRFEGA